MDPVACILRAIKAFRRKDYAEARRALEELYEWEESGGFMPRRVIRAQNRLYIASMLAVSQPTKRHNPLAVRDEMLPGFGPEAALFTDNH